MRDKLGTVGLVLALTPGIAAAQTSPSQTTPAPPATQATQPAQGTDPAQTQTPGAAPASSAAPKPAGTVAGYAYADKARPSGGVSHYVRVRRGAPVATLPGFEQLPDGGSRLFVDLSTQVPVEERRAAGSVTYVLKGAQVTHYNNTNALVTVHFNTPVYRARLVPSGADLLFIIELRDPKAAPQFKMGAKGTGGILTVDFAKGDYVPTDPATSNGDAVDTRPPR